MEIIPDVSINGRCYTLEEIRQGRYERHLTSDFERNVLRFAQSWLSGQSAFRIRSSGSTGPAKEISIYREKMLLSATLTEKEFGLAQGDPALLCLSPEHIAGMMMIVRSLNTGMPMICAEPSGNPLRSIPPGIQLRFGAMLPFQFENVLNEGYTGLLQGMKALLLGGAPISPALESAAAGLSLPVYQTFGMTETLSHFACRPISGAKRSDVYKALRGYRFRCDARSCLEVSGPVTDGNWITTNDVIDLQDDRHFRWLGRHDHIINSGGIKANPEHLESELQPCLKKLGIPPTYIIIGLPDDRLGEKICLVVEGGRSTAIPDHMAVEMSAYVSRQRIPREVFIVSSLYRTENGKIKRKEVARSIAENNYLIRKGLR